METVTQGFLFLSYIIVVQKKFLWSSNTSIALKGKEKTFFLALTFVFVSNTVSKRIKDNIVETTVEEKDYKSVLPFPG